MPSTKNGHCPKEQIYLDMVGTFVRGQEILAFHRDKKRKAKFTVKCGCGNIDIVPVGVMRGIMVMREKCRECADKVYKARMARVIEKIIERRDNR